MQTKYKFYQKSKIEKIVEKDLIILLQNIINYIKFLKNIQIFNKTKTINQYMFIIKIKTRYIRKYKIIIHKRKNRKNFLLKE